MATMWGSNKMSNSSHRDIAAYNNLAREVEAALQQRFPSTRWVVARYEHLLHRPDQSGEVIFPPDWLDIAGYKDDNSRSFEDRVGRVLFEDDDRMYNFSTSVDEIGDEWEYELAKGAAR